MSLQNEKIIGFKPRRTLTLLVVLCLVMFSAFYFVSAAEKAKDVRRLVDIKQIANALTFFQLKFSRFPESIGNKDGWEVSYKESGEFMKRLVDGGIMESVPVDPVNSENYFYRYQRFTAGSYGCQKPFIILQVINFEEVHEDSGVGQCPKRDFAREVPGGYTIQIFE